MKKEKIYSCLLSMLLSLTLFFSGCGPFPSRSDLPLPRKNPSTSSGKSSASGPVLKARSQFDALTGTLFRTAFEENGLSLHFTLKDPSAYGIRPPVRPFPSLTEKAFKKNKKELLRYREKLSSIDVSLLTKKQQLLYRNLKYYLDDQISLCGCHRFTKFLTADSGISHHLPLSLSQYQFYSEQDIRNYLSILTAVPDYLEEAFNTEKERLKTGLQMSDPELEHTINDIGRFLNSREDHLLITSFDEKVRSLPSLSEDQKTSYIKNNRNLVQNIILPAFSVLNENLISLKDEEGNGRDLGLCHYQGGREYYSCLLHSMTLSGKTPSDMIKLLQNRLSFIMKEVRKICLAHPGLPDKPSARTFSPESALQYLKTAIKTDYPPLSDLGFTVSPIPPVLKNNTVAAYYMIPPFDIPEENRIYYNDEPAGSSSLFTTLSHEGYPGHLYQYNYFMSTDPDPLYTVLDLTGYMEGWAYYAEIDSARFYPYRITDPELKHAAITLSRYDDEFGYCLSSLIDLYVNEKGFSRARISDFLNSCGLDPSLSDSFYEYAISEPGAFLQYYIGYLELLFLRKTAERSLSDKFSLLDFHRIILRTGPSYYNILEKEIDNWIKSVKK